MAEPGEIPPRPSPATEPPRGDYFQPRTTPVFEPKRRARTRGRRWVILLAVVAVLLGIVIGVWAAVLTAQHDVNGPASDGARAAVLSASSSLGDPSAHA